MTISYPISFPGSIQPRSLNIGGLNVMSVNRSPFSLKTQVQDWGGDIWTLDVTLPPLTPEQARDWQAFVLALRGQYGTFLFGDPLQIAPRGLWSGVPVVSGAGQEGNSLLTSGWTPGTTGQIQPGDYFSINNRLYFPTNQAGHDSDDDGNITVDIWPRIRESPGDATPLVPTSPKGTWRMASNDFQWSANVERVYDISFSAVEDR